MPRAWNTFRYLKCVRISLLCLVTLVGLAACADQTNDPAPFVPADPAAAPSSTVEPTEPAPAPDASASTSAGDDDDDDAGAHDAPVVTPTSTCTKMLTVILTVGVPGLSKWKTNGCWKPVVTDGAAVSSFRKCSTSTFKVANNPTAPNWAYDDTNPTHDATTEKNFFAACSNGATGDGYVFMAYNGGFRYLDALTVKAHFAELYTSTMTDIDSHNGVSFGAHTDVYPMMNFGPPASANLQAKVGTEAKKLCATVKTNGYFGLYNASWQDGMAADDARLTAVEQALDACTTD